MKKFEHDDVIKYYINNVIATNIPLESQVDHIMVHNWQYLSKIKKFEKTECYSYIELRPIFIDFIKSVSDECIKIPFGLYLKIRNKLKEKIIFNIIK